MASFPSSLAPSAAGERKRFTRRGYKTGGGGSGSQTDARSYSSSSSSLNTFCPNFIGNYTVNEDVSPKMLCCALYSQKIYLFLDEAALHLVAHLLGRHADRRHGAALGQVPAGRKNCKVRLELPVKEYCLRSKTGQRSGSVSTPKCVWELFRLEACNIARHEGCEGRTEG